MGAPDDAVSGGLDVERLVAEAERPSGSAAPGGDHAGAAPGPEPAAEPKPDTAAMIAGFVRMLLKSKWGRAFPSLAVIWTEPDIVNFSGALAPLADKYGYSPSWLEAWHAEIMALVICGPLIVATVGAVRVDLEAARAAAAKDAGSGSTAKPAADAAPGAAPGAHGANGSAERVQPRPTGEI